MNLRFMPSIKFPPSGTIPADRAPVTVAVCDNSPSICTEKCTSSYPKEHLHSFNENYAFYI